MTNPRDEELISAYLDGELTAEEQAQVERLLAESTELRQLYDDLRAVRSGLEALPRHRVPRDVSGAVLERAQRAKLAETAGSGGQSEVVGLPFSRGARPWIWAGAAIAAALLIMIFGRPRPGERPVAMQDRELAEDKGWGDAVSKKRADDYADAAPSEGGRELKLGMGPRNEVNEKLQAARRGDWARDSGRLEQSGGSRFAKGGTSGKSAARPESSRAKGDLPVSEEANDASRVSNLQSRAQRLELTDLDLNGDDAVKEAQNALADKRAERKDPLSKRSATRPEDEIAEAAANDVLVVSCTVTPEAEKQNAFEQVLTNNSIVVEQTPVVTFDTPTRASGSRFSAPKTPGSRFSISKNEGKESKVVLGGQPMPTNFDVFYVEATPQQVESTLAELKAQQHQFLSVDIDPAPNVSNQESLAFYNYNNANGDKALRQRAMNQSLRVQLEQLRRNSEGEQLDQHGALRGNLAAGESARGATHGIDASNGSDARSPAQEQARGYIKQQSVPPVTSAPTAESSAAQTKPAGQPKLDELAEQSRNRAAGDGPPKSDFLNRATPTEPAAPPASPTTQSGKSPATKLKTQDGTDSTRLSESREKPGTSQSGKLAGPATDADDDTSTAAPFPPRSGSKASDVNRQTPAIATEQLSDRIAQQRVAEQSPRKALPPADSQQPSGGNAAAYGFSAGDLKQAQLGDQIRVLFMLRVVDPQPTVPPTKKARN